MKYLSDILNKVSTKSIFGSTNIMIHNIEFDSRRVIKSTLFIAQKGLNSDGHCFIDKSIETGAIAIVCENVPENIKPNVTYIQVEDSNEALAIIASSYYDDPSEKLKLIGVTGTNGKTTVATLLYELFKKYGYKAGLLSTIKIMVDEVALVATHTTPNSIAINKALKDMVLAGVKYCFMEVSSHGIHQKRTAGLFFEGGVFTNLSHDHLDYHSSFAEYRNVKKIFFDNLPKTAFALVNIDDKNGSVMLQNTRAKKYSYSLKTVADFKVKIVENQFSGLLLNINKHEVWTKLIGVFNAYNLLAIYSVSSLLGLDEIEILRRLSELENVDGRFQHKVSPTGINSIVDYAHTPDALKNVLQTIQAIRTHKEQVITVVGCGGDRDKAKRPKTGNIASVLSDQVVFTSDNPRNEDPELIIKEIEEGVLPENLKKTISITDRRQAIKTACKLARKRDIILVAGKGHETYQIIGNEKLDFDDFKIVNEFLSELNK